ncbi:hypothetical protein SRB5_45030 [Streptomyces sp. RB5]|uniref:Uncharacterized protein n=1 Tax=Streptomyces smaragdinus TaxID=2585196 RepID=A0A7K0CLG9_9ACTN|nr:hypothetical protein [Streptomyces smaragdinus]MQY14339.1 hypothetical protein [Streptomyces smaragdinus]
MAGVRPLGALGPVAGVKPRGPRWVAALWTAAVGFGVEGVVTVVVLIMLTPHYEPAPGNYGLGVALAMFVGPIACTIAAVTVTWPVLLLSRWSARRRPRPETWWWCSATCVLMAAAGSLTLGVVCPLLLGVRPDAVVVVGLWLSLVVFASPATLLARAALNRHRHVASLTLGAAAVLIPSIVLQGAGLYAVGLLRVYEYPKVDQGFMLGTWSDDNGGLLTFTADGKVTADGVAEYDFESFGEKSGECDGTGTWTFAVSDTEGAQGVALNIPGCSYVTDVWTVGGSQDHPTVHQWMGDPDIGWYGLDRDR